MTYTTNPNWLYQEEIAAKVGDSLMGDEWHSPSRIIPGDEVDVEFFGTNLRYQRHDSIVPSLPVKVQITGRKVHISGYSGRKIRCLITTWDSNEEPVSFGGWLYLNADRR